MSSREQAPAAAELLAAFSQVMRRRRWRWYVFGGQAVLAYGRPRLTADVDVTVDLAESEPGDLVRELKRSSFDLRCELTDAFLAEARLLPFVHRKTGLPVDVVLVNSSLQAEFLERRKMIDAGGSRVPMISPEDLVATKILAGRRKDLEDARGVLLERGERLDLKRVRRVIEQLDAIRGGNKLRARLERLVRTLAR